jgi:catechol 2,3-dioxygenase-like lactoylglutathione lyase family enzyme
MMTMDFHRGRLIDHIQLRCADLDASRRFYEAVEWRERLEGPGAASGTPPTP